MFIEMVQPGTALDQMIRDNGGDPDMNGLDIFTWTEPGREMLVITTHIADFGRMVVGFSPSEAGEFHEAVTECIVALANAIMERKGLSDKDVLPHPSDN
jgi:hypothetical protein